MDKKKLHAMDEDWEVLKSFFPKGWEDLALSHQALKGLRKNKSAENLLRTLLIHVGRGCSLRETVVRAARANLAQLSDVALLNRLRKSSDWLYQLCRRLFEEHMGDCTTPNSPPVYLLDATTISEPGKTGSQWKLHYCLHWPSLRCDFFKLTSVKGAGNGEGFVQFPVERGGYYLADRGYCLASGIRYVTHCGGYMAVRLNSNTVRMYDENGTIFPLADKLKSLLKAGEPVQWPVTISDSRDDVAACGRLCVIRKSQAAIAEAQEKILRRARKNGVKVRPETLLYARFVIIFTTFDPERYPVEVVLEWYRLRWQIELIFKRFKQIAGLGHLPKHDPESSKAWLYGKLLVALLSEKLMAYGQTFSPWGYDMGKIAHPKPLA